MIIHTYVYNQNNFNLIEYENYMIWDYKKILNMIKKKYSEWEIFFKRLILNKSRENFLKYLVIYEYGGIFVNIELLKLINDDKLSILKKYNIDPKYKNKEMIFWMETVQKDFKKYIYEIEEFIINDDIFIIKNASNSFISYLLNEINKSIIPINEYQDMLYLGQIFLSIKLSFFYQTNLNIKITQQNTWFGFSNNLEDLYKNDFLNKYEKSIYYIELNNSFQFDEKYKLKIYPNVPDLSNNDNLLNFWDIPYKIKNYLENLFILLNFQNNNFVITMMIICLIISINFCINEYFKNLLDVKIKPASIDSKVFFNHKKFKFFKNLKKSWKIIRDEALDVMQYSPKLNISRTIEDWHNASNYFEMIQNKEGWIRSWSYEPEGSVENQTKDGNYEWLNYGLFYFGKEFTNNIKKCPKTYKLINKIKKHINICGFSWMLGGCLLQPHTDITGLTSGSLAMHLGLHVPKPNDSCRLIIKNNDNEYFYMNEENGKMYIFDATWEHYAYNLSNQDRLVLYIDFKI
jgi:beta-hydroxylase